MADDIYAQIKSLKEEILEDCLKYERNIAKYMAQKISDDMTDYSNSIIEDFYNQYNPHDPITHPNGFYYYRHNNFLKVVKRHYRKRGDSFVCGVELEKNLPNVYRGAYSSPEQVFNRVIFGGLHGYASLNIPKGITNVPPIYDPSPYMRIQKRIMDIYNDPTEYENYARSKAQKDSYKYITF